MSAQPPPSQMPPTSASLRAARLQHGAAVGDELPPRVRRGVRRAVRAAVPAGVEDDDAEVAGRGTGSALPEPRVRDGRGREEQERRRPRRRTPRRRRGRRRARRSPPGRGSGRATARARPSRTITAAAPMKSRSSRLKTTGIACMRRVPPPSSEHELAARASASAIPRLATRIASLVPWRTSTGQRTRGELPRLPRRRTSRVELRGDRASRASSRAPSRRQSSICFVECGSRRSARRRTRGSRGSRATSSGGCTSPTLVGVEPRPPRRRSPAPQRLGQRRGGPMKIAPATRSGCSAARMSSRGRPAS